MRFKMYWAYFKYVINHKWNVGKECFKLRLYFHAFTHDLSKFMPCEFFPYAKHFYGHLDKSTTPEKITHRREMFDGAWLRHQNRNKHHWQYWIDSEGNVFPMPEINILQMIADWRGMAIKFGDTAEIYYEKHKNDIRLHPQTRILVEKHLKV